ncbi:putative lipid II flippase FtsW [Motiliproteus sp. SC1-56]|uniref:putative lipid II flippase FtsW n=1 Tax=Motiliproteus sp. SC1-56 TaxID=2799565 RepID=UPI001A8EE86E|nr:putative lipid II flippase FtsW [Motiliproteus sp. SC1-56]
MKLPIALPQLPRVALPQWQRPDPLARPFDPWLLLAAVTLLVTGFLMITSASMEVAGVRNGSPFHFTQRHLAFIGIGMAAALLTCRFPMVFWQRTGHWWLMAALVLLVAVLIPGIGREVNGSIRWIRVGPVNIQPSEIAKVCMILYIAAYLVRRIDEVRTQWSGFIKPMVVVGLFIGLLIFEPDFGAVVVLTGTVLGMIFLSGMRLGQFLVVILGSLAMVALMAVSQPYRMQRLVTFLDPWADPFGSGYQLSQAQIAFGRGEIFGLGLGNSVQKLFYLPEAHTDFVFSVLAEELGLVGALIMVALFALLVVRVFYVGRRAERLGRFYGAYVAYGVGILIAGQALINMGVNVGVLPTKGLTLPLVSYGGSSLVMALVMLALVSRIHYESHRQHKAQREGAS